MFKVTESTARANRVRSLFNTLRRYHQTSMVAHQRPIASVRVYAKAVGTIVDDIADEEWDNQELQNLRRKVHEYIEQYKIIE